MTAADIHDVEVAPDLVDRVVDPVGRLHGDGAFSSSYLRAHLSRRFQPPP
ncbi:hypothetical protein [Pelagibius sp. Alg239-R121]